MTGRENLSRVFRREIPQRLPMLEWAMWWDLTLERWNAEGLDPNLDDRTRKKRFGLDYDLQFWLPMTGPEMPRFKDTGFIRDEADYDAIRPYLYNRQAVLDRIPEFDRIHRENELRGDITWITLEGFFWFPRVLFGIEDHFYSFYDQPELYHRICRDLTEFYTFVIDVICRHFEPQFMTFAEDMSYNLGPMLSRELFDTFLRPSYEQLIPLLKKKGIRVFVDSDGDVTKMIPWLMDAGVEGILPLEHQAGVDVDLLTRTYPDFFFLGGFDKTVMKLGEEAMDREFQRLLPAMRRGNFIPSVDHQTPPDVSLDTYRIYLQLLKHYCTHYR